MFRTLCVLCASAVFIILSSLPAHAADGKESAFERVMRTNEIRCGYGLGAPLVEVDPNTGEISGIMKDVMNEVGKALNMKVIWAEEVQWGQLATALQSGRVDLICSTLWASAGRGKQIAFTHPLFFSRVDAFARADDKRFDNDLSRINQKDVRIIVEESDVTEEIAVNDFPDAQRVYKPQMAGDEYHFLSLTGDKADIVLLNTSYALDYEKMRPGTIRQISLPRPLRVYGNVLGIEIHEQEFQDLMNAAVDQLLYSGAIMRIMRKYEKDYPGVLMPVADPYEVKR